MRCQRCNQNEATTHIRQNINGHVTEMYLCPDCAKELHANDMFEPFNLGSFFGNFLGASTAAFNALAGVDRCGYCNSSLNDIVSSGKMGCAHCYDKFYEQLYPSLERMHGNVHHIGKHVHYTQENETDAKKEAPKAENPLSEVDRLKEELKEAIKTQNFERAAVLRDTIKELEGDK
ncbi:MAG TPA: UvrB/UvrC motif-containing protein [Candidatus Scubalenecus merdavium]|uniref:UvrB/UvrC motif-containing protein n=1 Tax=Candidatus Scybalenecus merdavium TaxID=2840939 RepID=A0A9D1MTL3_9FIRM|nr:UvrB/UvrC motif-containing protein [Candidatus Scubalenecus merdavium]